MTATIDPKAAKSFIHDIDNRIASASVFPTMAYLVKELQEIRNEAAVLLGMDVPTELDKLKEKMNNGKV